MEPLLSKEVELIEKLLIEAKVIGQDALNKETAKIVSELIASHRLLKIRYDVKAEKIIKILGE